MIVEVLSVFRDGLKRSGSSLTSGIEMVICVDGRVDLNDLEEISVNWTRKIVLTVAMRLGLTKIHKVRECGKRGGCSPHSMNSLVFLWNCILPGLLCEHQASPA